MTGRPKIRESLVIASHEKDGRRFVTALDPKTLEVTLLLPWENAVLVLCDGSRTVFDLSKLLEEHGEQPKPIADIERCLASFKTARLIDELAPPRGRQALPRSRTVAELQQAYMEWHKVPDQRSQLLQGYMPADMPDPFVDEPKAFIPKGRSPTVAHPQNAPKNDSPWAPRDYDSLPPSELETHQVGFYDPLGFQEAASAYEEAESSGRPTLPMTSAVIGTEADPMGEAFEDSMTGALMDDPPPAEVHKTVTGTSLLKDPYASKQPTVTGPPQAPKSNLFVHDEPARTDSADLPVVRSPSPSKRRPQSRPAPRPTPRPNLRPNLRPNQLDVRDAVLDAIHEGPVPSHEEFEEATAELGQHSARLEELSPHASLLRSPKVQGVRRELPQAPNEETIKFDVPENPPVVRPVVRKARPRAEATLLVPGRNRKQQPPAEEPPRRRRRRPPDDDD